jgi:hypothetical protein
MIYRGFIAPIGLYGALCLIALKNKKQNNENPPQHAPKGDA